MTTSCSAFRIAALAAAVAFVPCAVAQAPAVGPNVNIVSGTKWPQGDPFLTKQNEPSIAVSSRNSRHLVAGVNDYRLVPAEIVEGIGGGKAWIQVYKSVDGGGTWRSTPLGGCPLNVPECLDSTGLTASLRARAPTFSADPTFRAGPYGTFFLSFIAGQRSTGDNGVIAVQRFVDRNDDIQRVTDVRSCTAGSPDCVAVYDPPSCTGAGTGCTLKGHFKIKSAEDPILPDVMNIIAVGTPGQFNDKPWVVADVGRRKWNGTNKTCELLSWTKNRTDVRPAAETVGAFSVYVSFANFTGQGQNEKPSIYVAASNDCGRTFAAPVKVSNPLNENQGTTSAVDPLTGHVYVAWRNFDGVDGSIYVVKSIDGGATWTKNPIRVATFKAYDQGATSASFRTLDFPSVAVSVKREGNIDVSRVHLVWTQRKVAPLTTPPYGCPQSANPADCDTRIVMSTSTDGGATWRTPVPVDSNFANPLNPLDPNGRGHQVQPALTFAAGKLMVTWLDNRLDHTEGVLVCPTGQTCTNVSQLVETRRPARNGNLHPSCSIDTTKPEFATLDASQKALLQNCYNPAAVWTPYITDGTPGLVRRHTIDTFAAMADPGDAPQFTSSRVSQYTFGTTVQGTVNADGSLTPDQRNYEIVQKEVNPPNLPMFANGSAAFIGDYIDVIGQAIVASGDPAQPYKFNVGGTASGSFVTGGLAPAFHVAFTDNRDVIPPLNGDWSNPTCTTTAFKKDANGNVIGVDPTVGCGSPGYAGNRNANVYTAAITEHSVAFAGTNSKLLNATTPRGFVVTVRNLSDVERTYTLTLPASTPSFKASFDAASFPSGVADISTTVTVQPKSSSARTVWVTSSAPTAKVNVQIASAGGFSTQVLLNPDANAPLVTNGDGTTADTSNDNLGNVVLSNAVLTNNALSNNALTNAVLSNNALTNAALSNVVLSNAVLSNLDPETAALSNNVLTNAVLSNVVLSNAALSNAALSNAVLSNVVLSNTVINAALTNVDPANVALSNAVLSNNALTNVVLSNTSPNAALSNAMLTNAALTNAALSNVVLSNAALSNNVLSNDPLRNAALSNAPLTDPSNGTDPDADPLRTIETGAPEIAKNAFESGDLANSNFKETTFTIRNRGNIDTTIAVKLMLRDAICSGAPNYTCTTPPEYKLQLVLRKVSLVPVAIPPTGPAVATGRAIRIGLAQSNTEVSNTSDLPLVDPNDPNFGKFLPEDPKAAMLSLAAGEYAYATIRAIGVGGATPPDPADLLRWGVKTVATDALSANGPLIIRTLGFPTPFVALDTATPTLRTFGGKAPISGSAVCTDDEGNEILTGVGPPSAPLGALGNFYVDSANRTLYGPKTASGWGSSTPLIVNGPSGPQSLVACPPTGISVGAFTTDASFNSTADVTFTSRYWGDFFMLANVGDASAPQQTDRQVIKVTILPRPPVITYTNFPTQLTFNQGVDLAPLVSSDSVNGAGTPQPILFSIDPASDTCRVAADGHTLVVDHASPPVCSVKITLNGNEIYAPKSETKLITILPAAQTIVLTPPPATLTYNNNGAPAATLIASATSTTAPNSGLAVTFTSLTTGVCTTGGTNGEQITIQHAGTCTIRADQAGDRDYLSATLAVPNITIVPAAQTIVFDSIPTTLAYNNNGNPVTLAAHATSTTAPDSNLPVTFTSLTTGVCTMSGAQLTIASAGTCNIRADQAGNLDYLSATLTRNITINPADQAITFGAAPSNITFGDPPVTVSATSNSPTAPPSGEPITFASQTTSVCTNVGGTVTIVAAGTCTIAADQAGNTNYNAAPQVTQSFSIARGKLFVTTSVSPTSFVYGDDVPPAPVSITTGSSFTGPTACNVTPFATTQSGVPTAPANAGTYTITSSLTSTLHSSCDAFFTDATLTVTQAPIAFTVTAQQFIDLGAPKTFTGKLNRTGKPTVFPVDAPTVLLKKGAATVATYNPTPAGPDGVLSVTDNAIASDSYTLAWSYAGSANFLAATPVTSELRVEGFSPAATMVVARTGHTSTLLADGNVLIVAGTDASGAPNATAEIYCAVASAPCAGIDVGTFKAVTVTLAFARTAHTATRMSDGNVLITGGSDAAGPLSSAEMYCTAAAGPLCTVADIGKFRSANAMGAARSGHAANLLTDGTVLISGGVVTGGTPTNTTEVYCTAVTGSACTLPAHVGTFQPSGTMGTARANHTATLLSGGNVLVTGGAINVAGAPTDTAEVYSGGAFVAASGLMASARKFHSATLLADNRVLIAGGDSTAGQTASADVYCAVVVANCAAGDAGTFKAVGPLATARAAHTSTVLTDGFPLVVGGRGAGGPLDTSELFDPGVNAFATAATMASKRSGASATLLGDGRVLVTGGQPATGSPPTNSAEFFNGPY